MVSWGCGALAAALGGAASNRGRHRPPFLPSASREVPVLHEKSHPPDRVFFSRWPGRRGHGDDAAGIVIDGLPRRLVFRPENRIVTPALPTAAADAAIATYVQGTDAWHEFNYGELLSQLVST